MKTNSLALRLFLTAAAWVVSILPIAGYIIYARYRHEVVTTFDSRIALFLAVVINDAEQASAEGPSEPEYWGEGLFVQTHSGWYWQMVPLDGKPAEILQSRPPGRAGAFKAGDRIFHDKFGYGKVEQVEGNKLDIAFEHSGRKKVIDSFVQPA